MFVMKVLVTLRRRERRGKCCCSNVAHSQHIESDVSLKMTEEIEI